VEGLWLLLVELARRACDRKGSGFADVEPGADSFEVGIYQIRDGKAVANLSRRLSPASTRKTAFSLRAD
jgi:hypothetical protein